MEQLVKLINLKIFPAITIMTMIKYDGYDNHNKTKSLRPNIGIVIIQRVHNSD